MRMRYVSSLDRASGNRGTQCSQLSAGIHNGYDAQDSAYRPAGNRIRYLGTALD